MAVRFDSFLRRFKGESVIGRIPPISRSLAPYPVVTCAAGSLSLTFVFLFSTFPLYLSFFSLLRFVHLISFIMPPPRVYGLIRIIALCEFNRVLRVSAH